MTKGLALVAGAQATSKIVRAYMVSSLLWLEVAAWRTSKSGLEAWSFRVFRFGFRVTSPLFGFSVGAWT